MDNAITVHKYVATDKNLWDNFVKNAKNSLFMHYRDYMEYHADRFTDNSLLFFNEDKIVALLPLNIKDSILYSHGGLTFGGFIVSSKMKAKKMLDCFDILKQYMSENKIVKMIYKPMPHIYHILPAEDDLYALYKNNAHIVKIEPTTTIDLKNIIKMPKGRKAQIVRAKREGVFFQESLDFDSFMALENTVLEEYHNTHAVHTADEIKKLRALFPQNIKLYVAVYQGGIIAGTIIFEYDHIVHTQYIAANDAAREIGALDYVISELINKYAETKQYFDFGISTEDNGMFLNEGLIAQKESFGGRTVVHQVWEMQI